MESPTAFTRPAAVCKRCGEAAGPTDVVTLHARSDPLQVSECAHCGAIVGIGGHQW